MSMKVAGGGGGRSSESRPWKSATRDPAAASFWCHFEYSSVASEHEEGSGECVDIHWVRHNELFHCAICSATWWADALNYRLHKLSNGHTHTHRFVLWSLWGLDIYIHSFVWDPNPGLNPDPNINLNVIQHARYIWSNSSGSSLRKKGTASFGNQKWLWWS